MSVESVYQDSNEHTFIVVKKSIGDIMVYYSE